MFLDSEVSLLLNDKGLLHSTTDKPTIKNNMLIQNKLVGYKVETPQSNIKTIQLNCNINNNNDKLQRQTTQGHHQVHNKDNIFLLEDNVCEFNIADTHKYTNKQTFINNVPTKITGTFNMDYNILYVDDIIRKKLEQEKITLLPGLRNKYRNLEALTLQPQTYIMRTSTLSEMENISKLIKEIETGETLRQYNNAVKDLVDEYRKSSGYVKTVIFDLDIADTYEETTDDKRERIIVIDKFLEIAKNYIELDIIRTNTTQTDVCLGCNSELSSESIDETGVQRCSVCQTEYTVMILSKMSKEISHISSPTNTDDESIDNFIRSFVRYQGLQPNEHITEELFSELDHYFSQYGRPLGCEVRLMSLNKRGRRGDTDHKMLWTALRAIGRSDLYEDTNLIGNLYWGWTLHNIMHYKETIISHYMKTQKVFYQIPSQERGRASSLGTQFRLWRHLQLVGHECYQDEFKIAENAESMRTHNRLWQLMCEGANDPDIFYIP
jgi:hypothetical protein